ncbi:MAG: hypothetical protein ACRC2T_02635 [Thermoguttaceae bacterium]
MKNNTKYYLLGISGILFAYLFVVFFTTLFPIDSFNYSDHVIVTFPGGINGCSLQEEGVKRVIPDFLTEITTSSSEAPEYGLRSTYTFYDGLPEKGKVIGSFFFDEKLDFSSMKDKYEKNKTITPSVIERGFDFLRKPDLIQISIIEPSTRDKSDITPAQEKPLSYTSRKKDITIYCVSDMQFGKIKKDDDKEYLELPSSKNSHFGMSTALIERGMKTARHMTIKGGVGTY